MKKVTVPFFISHQGCPHTCLFCDQRTISGSPGYLPSPDEIRGKIQSWGRFSGDRPLEVAFFGGTFTALPVPVQDRLLDPLQPLFESGEIASVRISTRPDGIDDRTVRRLMDRGVRTIEIGVQSMDDEVLGRSGRGHSAAVSEAAIRCIRAAGLSAGAQIMPGLPGDTRSRSLETLKKVISAGASFVRIYPVVILQGTGLERLFRDGAYRPLGLDEGVQLCKRLLHEALTSGVEVVRIGLQADEGLNHDTIVAGCWHPALGQLVRSELYFDLICSLLPPGPDDQTVSIRCHPTRISDVAGNGKHNLTRLKLRIPNIVIESDENLVPEEIALSGPHFTNKGTIIRDLNYTPPEER